jgi:hypothetical protein
VNWLVIEGVKPYDGRYEFDLENNELTTREWGWIKRLSGYLPLTLEEGLMGADPELFACFAVLMLRRAGKVSNTDVQELFDRVCDAPFGSTIRLEADDTEEAEADDAGPPAGSSSGNEPSSGDGSPVSSESSVPPRNGTGTPGSASSAFEQLTSGS